MEKVARYPAIRVSAIKQFWHGQGRVRGSICPGVAASVTTTTFNTIPIMLGGFVGRFFLKGAELGSMVACMLLEEASTQQGLCGLGPCWVQFLTTPTFASDRAVKNNFCLLCLAFVSPLHNFTGVFLTN